MSNIDKVKKAPCSAAPVLAIGLDLSRELKAVGSFHDDTPPSPVPEPSEV